MVTMRSPVTYVSVCVALIVAISSSGCTPRVDGPEVAASAFFAELATGNTSAAAELVDKPDDARTALNAAWSGLQATHLDAQILGSRYTEDTGAVNYRYTWHLPKDRVWTYDGILNMVREEGRWEVRWSGADLHPKLGQNQTLELRGVASRRASVNEVGGTNVMVPGFRYHYELDARSAGEALMPTARAVVDALRPFDNTLDNPQRLAEQASSTNGPMNLITLRRDDNDKVAPVIGHLPGVVVTPQADLLPTDDDFAPALLSEVKKTVMDQLDGEAGWQVVSVNQNGVEVDVLNDVAPKPAPSVSVTLDRAVQDAAQEAVNAQGRKAMLVVIRPSTGDILAVAQNSAADADGPTATMGLYPPGSTFKIITASAAIERDLATPNTMLDCPGVAEIGHRIVPNYNKFDLGTVPMATAFANSCNTTFAELASRMPPRALNQVAAQYGIGTDYVIDGLPTVTGSVPPTVDLTERTEDGFGQGKVLASPFGMALAAATVAAGKTPVPRLIVGRPTEVKGQQGTPDAVPLDGMRSMMRLVITNGTAKDLKDVGDVRGKTGEAEYAGGSHAWFAGYRGDMAFAGLIVGGGSSEYAVRMTKRMLGNLPPDYLG
jgi:hypothetical protein